jgi:hypothetical protein
MKHVVRPDLVPLPRTIRGGGIWIDLAECFLRQAYRHLKTPSRLEPQSDGDCDMGDSHILTLNIQQCAAAGTKTPVAQPRYYITHVGNSSRFLSSVHSTALRTLNVTSLSPSEPSCNTERGISPHFDND